MTYHDRTTSWFLAQFKPNCHHVAERNLCRQGFRTFLPMQQGTQRRNGRFHARLRPLFPGYIFIALDTSEGGWGAINNTYGVSRLVGFGNGPCPVPRDLISQLQLCCDEGGIYHTPPALRPGDRVKIGAGPFAEFLATVKQVTPDRRVWVLLDLMGRMTRVAVEAEAVRVQ